MGCTPPEKPMDRLGKLRHKAEVRIA
jgi:hypothetical protein